MDDNFLYKINREISARNYDNIIDICINAVIENLYEANKEYIYAILEKLVIISDKTSVVSEKIINNLIVPIIYNKDSLIKMSSLVMLERISRFKPNLVINLIETLERNLNDEDNTIRELSYKVIGNLFLNSEYEKDYLLSLVFKAFNDTNWKIRMLGLNICRDAILKLNKYLSKDIINKIIEKISSMILDEDEEIQTASVESLVKIYKYIDSKVMFYIILKLIGNPNPYICEKGVWLIGEIASVEYSDIIEDLLPKFNVLIDEANITIQTKIIDSLVKIGRNYTEKILQFIFANIKEITDKNLQKERYNIYFDVVAYLGFEIPEKIIPKILKIISEEFGKNAIFTDFICNILIKINEELSDILEQYIAKEFSNFDDINWQVRLNSVRFVGIINTILKSESIAVWSELKLKDLLKEENDPDVIEAINESLNQINLSVDNLTILSKEINQELNLLYQQMIELQKYPLILKEKLLKILQRNEFREAAIAMEEMINETINKIESFGKQIYNYRFKRLALDLLEDWAYLRLEILEQLSDLKTEIKKEIDIAKQKYVEELKKKIEQIRVRIDVLKSELDFLIELNNEIKQLILNGETLKSKKKLEHLAYIRDKIYRLESEIGTLWIENLDFKEALQDITFYWVQVKIEAQQLLYTISYNLRDLHQYMENIQKEKKEKAEEFKIKEDLSFELLLNEFQNIILQSTKNVQEQFERFSMLTAPVYEEIKKENFESAENLLDFAINQTISNVEEFNKEIQKVYTQLEDISEKDVEKSKMIRKYLDDWNLIRESLLQKAEEFYQSTSNEIFLQRIKAIQKLINPIPINSIAKLLNKKEDEVLDKLFSLIQDNKLEGKIIENKLYLPEKYGTYNRTISISRKMELLGNKIILMIRLENTTKDFLHDLDILLSIPGFLVLDIKQSNQKWIHYESLKPEEIKIFKWIFQLKKSTSTANANINIKTASQYNNQQDSSKVKEGFKYGELRLLVKYKDIFNEQIELDKRIDIITHL
ncbi:MAG: hypothetical protein ACTSRZ_05000 [Promethearchaeota archaeon]